MRLSDLMNRLLEVHMAKRLLSSKARRAEKSARDFQNRLNKIAKKLPKSCQKNADKLPENCGNIATKFPEKWRKK